MNLFHWRKRLLDSDLPSTTKLVLLVIASYMNIDGEGAFPSTRRIAANASLSQRAVITHIKMATRAGFIIVFKEERTGQNWALNHYRIGLPAPQGAEPRSARTVDSPCDQTVLASTQEAMNQSKHLETEGAEPDTKGAESDDRKVLNEIQPNSPMKSQITDPASAATATVKRISPIPEDWLPSHETYLALHAQGIPSEFTYQQVFEFRLYWVDDGRGKASWNSAFYTRCLQEWNKSGHQWSRQRRATHENR
ncbi:MAG TPA: hypothetical protein DIW43_10430 [Spongiibacteraceae bacterium]|nr:hypothetical protein [Spongiibacteraceae bacterium]HCS27861.1 hypothetical protein [Spongiibacteraceae bacterium]